MAGAAAFSTRKESILDRPQEEGYKALGFSPAYEVGTLEGEEALVYGRREDLELGFMPDSDFEAGEKLLEQQRRDFKKLGKQVKKKI